MLILTSVILGIVSMFLSFYINWPLPELTDRALKWKNAGFYYRFNDFDIFLRDDQGDGNGDDILICLHGFPTSSYDWEKIWPTLKKRFGRVVAPDFLGHGFSSKPLDYRVINVDDSSIDRVDHNYTFAEQTNMVVSLLQHLNVTASQNLHILAHDYGDTVLQELLYRYNQNLTYKLPTPFRIKSVALTNGGIFADLHTPTWGQQVLAGEYGPFLSKLLNRWIFDYSLSKVFGAHKPTADDLEDWWSITCYNQGYLAMPKVLYYIKERHINQERWTGALRDTTVPLHMIYGPADPVNPPPFAQVYKERLPRATITVLPADIGHYVQWEAPDLTVQDYLRFLKTV